MSQFTGFRKKLGRVLFLVSMLHATFTIIFTIQTLKAYFN